MEGFLVILFVAVFTFALGMDFGTDFLTKQDCPICELDNNFNAQTNYTCFTMGLAGMTICTCPDGQYTINARCRLCDRPQTCGSGGNIFCTENPTANPPGYACFCPNNQFTFNKPCSDLTTTTQKTTITTTTQSIVTSSDSLGKINGKINVTENGQVAERDHALSYVDGAAVRGLTLRSIGIHRIRLRIERMYMNRKLFIGVQSSTIRYCGIDNSHGVENIAPTSYSQYCTETPASGWFGNDTIAMHGRSYSSSSQATDYTGNYEQYYMTNDIIILTINCEDATLTLKNERTNKEYQIFINDHIYPVSRLPWILYINLYYPGDKIRILS